jgi:exonuclease SbcC
MIHLKALSAENFKQLRNVELTFPRRFCTLVEGLNEAGKSTLIEAIYFALYGQGLSMRGDGRGQLSSLITHGGTSAEVTLGLQVHDTNLRIVRRVRQNRPSEAEITVLLPDGEEVVRGVRKVNQEILARVNKLDGEALLSSCFVQQKQLGQLEDLDRAKRQDILLKLLDMERLNRLKSSFRWTAEDVRALTTARDKFRLAQLSREVEGARQELETRNRLLMMAELHAAIEAYESHLDAARTANSDAAAHKAEAERIKGQITRVEALDKFIATLEQVLQAREFIASREQDADSICTEIIRLTELEREALPAHRLDLEQVDSLKNQIRQIADLEKEREECAGRAERLGSAIEANRNLAEPREQLAQLLTRQEAAAAEEREARERFEAAKQLEAMRQEIARYNLEIKAIEARKSRLTAAIDRAEALIIREREGGEMARALDAKKEATEAARAALENATRVEALRSTASELETAIGTSSERQVWLEHLLQQASTLEQMKGELGEAEAQSVAARVTLEEVERQYLAVQQSHALRRWAGARRDADLRARKEKLLAELNAKAQAARTRQSQAAEREKSGRRTLAVGAGLTAAGVLIAVAGVLTMWILILAGIGVAATGMGIYVKTSKQVAQIRQEREGAERDSIQLERETRDEEVRRQMLSSQTPLDMSGPRDELLRLGVSEPASAEAADRQAAELAREQSTNLGSRLDEVRAQAEGLDRIYEDKQRSLSVEEQSLLRELHRAGLEAPGQVVGAIEDEKKKQIQFRANRAAIQKETEQLCALLLPRWSIEQLTEKLNACEKAERDLEIEVLSLKREIATEKLHVQKLFSDEGVTDASAASSLIEQGEASLIDLTQKRQAAEGAALQFAAKVPEGLSADALFAQFQEISSAVKQIEGAIGEQRARIQTEEERIEQALATEGVSDLNQAERTIRDLQLRSAGIAAQVGEAWEAASTRMTRWQVPINTIAAQEVLAAAHIDITSRIKVMEEQVSRLPALQNERERIRRDIEAQEKTIESHYNVLSAAADAACCNVDFTGRTLSRDLEASLLSEATAERAQHDLPGLRQAHQQEIEAKSDEEANAKQSERLAQDQARRARQSLLSLGVVDIAELTHDNIASRLDGFADVTSDSRSQLESQVEEMRGRLYSLEGQAQKLEQDLHADRHDMDYTACERQLNDLEKRQAICSYAAPVLDTVRENILRSVLPATLNYMCKLLPPLTCGRYHEARLDEESYRIRVWDSRARDYIEKDIFSGATQDQFSLALRLAFALATLPEGLGAQPKFIFLDEPTAGFDGERRKAFVELLTSGELSERFDQIFLLSPQGIFETNPLPHYIRIANGRVVGESLSSANGSNA